MRREVFNPYHNSIIHPMEDNCICEHGVQSRVHPLAVIAVSLSIAFIAAAVWTAIRAMARAIASVDWIAVMFTTSIVILYAIACIVILFAVIFARIGGRWWLIGLYEKALAFFVVKDIERNFAPYVEAHAPDVQTVEDVKKLGEHHPEHREFHLPESVAKHYEAAVEKELKLKARRDAARMIATICEN